MLTIEYTSSFKKDFKKIKKRGYDLVIFSKITYLLICARFFYTINHIYLPIIVSKINIAFSKRSSGTISTNFQFLAQ